MASRCGVSMLDLPIDASGRSLLEAWFEAICADDAGADRASIIACSPKTSPTPGRFRPLPAGVRFVPDRGDVRGTGGSTLDALEHATDDEWVLIAEAGRIPIPPFAELVAARAADDGAAVYLGVHADQSPAGVMLASVGALRRGRKAQFSDLKEQILPELIARGEVVRGVTLSRTSHSIRTRAEYLAALANALEWASAASDGVRARIVDRGIRDSIVCAGASVSVGATLGWSVLLPGARVGADAVVISSVLGPSAVVRSSEKMIEREA